MYKAKQLMFNQINIKTCIHILEDGASGVQLGEIEQMLSEICLENDKITLK